MCEAIGLADCFITESKNLINKVEKLKDCLDHFLQVHMYKKCWWPCLLQEGLPLFRELDQPQARLRGLLELINLKNNNPNLPLTLEDVLACFTESSAQIEKLRLDCKKTLATGHLSFEDWNSI